MTVAFILILVLVLAAIIVGWIDTYDVQRDYADLYAERHHHIPPLVDWFFKSDADPDVDALRRLHRNLTVVSGGLASAAVVVALVVRISTPA